MGEVADDPQIVNFQDASQYAFESGVLMACLIILHNWFPVEVRNFTVALWLTSRQLVTIVQVRWYNEDDTEQLVSHLANLTLDLTFSGHGSPLLCHICALPLILPPSPIARWRDGESQKQQRLLHGGDNPCGSKHPPSIPLPRVRTNPSSPLESSSSSFA